MVALVRFLLCTFSVLSIADAGAKDKEVVYRVAPYVWTAGIDGDLGPPRFITDADVSFSDYAKFLDAGFAFAAEARGDKWSIAGDFLWVKLSDNVDLPRKTLDFENEQYLIELALSYRPDAWESVRPLVGLRYTKMDTKFEVDGVGEIDIGDTWIDPFVGVEWRSRRGAFEWAIEADIGGGNDADFTWAYLIGGSYFLSDGVAISASYRFIDIDFDSDEFVFDGSMEGLLLGVLMEF